MGVGSPGQTGARAWATAPVAPSAQGGGLGAAPARASALVDHLPRGLPSRMLTTFREMLDDRDLVDACEEVASGPMPAWAQTIRSISREAHDASQEAHDASRGPVRPAVTPLVTREDLQNACTATLGPREQRPKVGPGARRREVTTWYPGPEGRARPPVTWQPGGDEAGGGLAPEASEAPEAPAAPSGRSRGSALPLLAAGGVLIALLSQ